MKACPICREQHEEGRGLSFDGKGVNDCGIYAARLATLSDNCPDSLGPVFAAAPAMLETLIYIRDHCTGLPAFARALADKQISKATASPSL